MNLQLVYLTPRNVLSSIYTQIESMSQTKKG